LRELHRAWAFFRIEIKRGEIREKNRENTKGRKRERRNWFFYEARFVSRRRLYSLAFRAFALSRFRDLPVSRVKRGGILVQSVYSFFNPALSTE
jgi:hypothetical protein